MHSFQQAENCGGTAGMVNCCEASATEGREGNSWHAGRLRSRRTQIHDFGWRAKSIQPSIQPSVIDSAIASSIQSSMQSSVIDAVIDSSGLLCRDAVPTLPME